MDFRIYPQAEEKCIKIIHRLWSVMVGFHSYFASYCDLTEYLRSFQCHNCRAKGGEKPLFTGILWLSTALDVAWIFLNITKVFRLRGLNVSIHHLRPAATAHTALMSSAVRMAYKKLGTAKPGTNSALR